MIRRSILAPIGLALCPMLLSPAFAHADGYGDFGGGKTATPIKHVIVLIGENRSFDNVYGTYEPRPGQSISNLRTKGIVREDGSLGPKQGLAAQVALNTIPSQYFIHQPASNKSPYATLPAPNTSYLPAIGVTLASDHAGSRGLARAVRPRDVFAARSFILFRLPFRWTPCVCSRPAAPARPSATSRRRRPGRFTPRRDATKRTCAWRTSCLCPTACSRSRAPSCPTTATRATWSTAFITCGSSPIAARRTPRGTIPAAA